MALFDVETREAATPIAADPVKSISQKNLTSRNRTPYRDTAQTASHCFRNGSRRKHRMRKCLIQKTFNAPPHLRSAELPIPGQRRYPFRVSKARKSYFV